MHVFPGSAPIRFFPFGKVRIPQGIFFVLYIEVSLRLWNGAPKRERRGGRGSPPVGIPPRREVA